MALPFIALRSGLRMLFSVFLLTGLILSAGCGQKGPLYLPEPTPETSVNTDVPTTTPANKTMESQS